MDFDVAYEGKAKQLILLEDDRDHYVQRFKDDATAFNGEKFAQFEGKGALNNAISSFLFEKLEEAGVLTHYIERRTETDMLIRKLEIVPLEVVVRNHVAGSLGRRTGLKEGSKVDPPIVETYYKKDELGDPILADVHIKMLDIVDDEELDQIKQAALRVNDVLQPIFEKAGIRLVDFKLEFGVDSAGAIILGDEISPDTSRLWDIESGDSLDKDVFRYDKGELIEAYEEVAERLGVEV
ncbi:phosphoribosylaminoimidazolesuccinocarboxamide synthase [Persicimonas caeni]|uniref:Phosphoribosylaminoimidazole-succinocarboxamide synthase n=1 Tax=Persicimonas caeni TaxID=2292766 RepID=A0A4Y6PMF0_PERCE|nr:phosphoribosylaminoimidazolesuccinocarboxamide synthase [Persicimonas caeni]QDG49217.1 phosphoribosylaminoimidazolesuccinocarboxamide synthase [Persicimonas caeni]QED30438.1 phosphoribosylaminoimidazolesuccinocarboxamide synthase [Persicimonas caeni]